MTDASVRILILGAFDPDYPRHAIIIGGLMEIGVRPTLAMLPKDASTLRRIQLALRWWLRFRQFDVILIPAFNQTLAPFIWLLSRLTGTQILLDYMVGLTDVNADRGTVTGLKHRLYRWVDRFNISQINSVTDTAAHREWFAHTLQVSTRRMKVLPVGVKPAWMDAPAPQGEIETLMVGFIGTYIPFQGVDVILQAAHLLRAEPGVKFVLIGGGQTYKDSRQLAETLQLDNIEFFPGHYSLPQLMAITLDCAVLLGVFGDVEKTRYVIPNKVFDGLAAGRVVITAGSPALLESFIPGEHLLVVPPGDPEKLAETLLALLDQPTQISRIGAAGQARIREAYLPEHIAAHLLTILQKA